ncbi:MAG: 23S rRNA (guanosine(2251)-2'-O)-methyltransferase RlmB [Polaribacter sp.]|jgi:23S rRNA (guanosine2251-2'-O)-methyltransferase
MKIFGIRAILEAIENEETLEKVFLQRDLRGSLYNELQHVIRKNNISFSYVPKEKLDRLSKNNNHQGAVAHISQISFHDLEELISKSQDDTTTPLFLLLDQISDVRNFGAIMRTAECCGVSGIIIPQSGSAPVNAESIKTSAGAAFKIPICKVNHLKDAIFLLQSYDIETVAATEKTEESIYDVDFKNPMAIIMGSEGRGINPSILKIVNHKAKIPLKGEIESLNVSVACGVFLYEAVRQRDFR